MASLAIFMACARSSPLVAPPSGVRRFRKRLMISETGYPSGLMRDSYPYDMPVAGYPLTEAGQRNFIGELVNCEGELGYARRPEAVGPRLLRSGRLAADELFRSLGPDGDGETGARRNPARRCGSRVVSVFRVGRDVASVGL